MQFLRQQSTTLFLLDIVAFCGKLATRFGMLLIMSNTVASFRQIYCFSLFSSSAVPAILGLPSFLANLVARFVMRRSTASAVSPVR